MSLELSVPDVNPPTGLKGTTVKPITEGQRAVAVKSMTSKSGIFSVLDQIGTTIGNTIGQAVQIKADQKLSELNNDGPQSSIDSTGDPFDNPQNTQAKNQSFFEKYKKELLIGGAVVVGVVGLSLLVKK